MFIGAVTAEEILTLSKATSAFTPGSIWMVSLVWVGVFTVSGVLVRTCSTRAPALPSK